MGLRPFLRRWHVALARQRLRQADPANPYLFLLDGALLLARTASKEAV